MDRIQRTWYWSSINYKMTTYSCKWYLMKTVILSGENGKFTYLFTHWDKQLDMTWNYKTSFSPFRIYHIQACCKHILPHYESFLVHKICFLNIPENPPLKIPSVNVISNTILVSWERTRYACLLHWKRPRNSGKKSTHFPVFVLV